MYRIAALLAISAACASSVASGREPTPEKVQASLAPAERAAVVNAIMSSHRYMLGDTLRFVLVSVQAQLDTEQAADFLRALHTSGTVKDQSALAALHNAATRGYRTPRTRSDS